VSIIQKITSKLLENVRINLEPDTWIVALSSKNVYDKRHAHENSNHNWDLLLRALKSSSYFLANGMFLFTWGS
jgi:hypothetical protein